MSTISEDKPATTRFDPVKLAVLASRFDSVVRTMTHTLERSARSTIITTGRDFSCCVITAGNELLSVAESLPTHVFSGPDLMARSMLEFHPQLRPGDAFLHNSPYHGNSHAADLSILIPVFDEQGTHWFTVLSKAHQADIGNAEPTTYSGMARDVYEEGALIFPCVQVQRDYSDIDDIIRMCQMRIRVPEHWWGDYLALLGSARVGERALHALAAEVGWDELDQFVDAWFDYSEAAMAHAIERLPDGEITVHAMADPYERVPGGVPVNVNVTVDSGRVVVDLRDNIDCQPFGLNLTEATSKSAAMMGVFNALHANVPPNAGSFRRIEVLLRENCCVGIPRHPASCSVSTLYLLDRVANSVQRGIAELSPGFGMAEVGGSFPGSVSVISGRDSRYGDRPFIDQIMLGWTGGAGGPHADGWLMMAGIGDAGAIKRDSIEIDEVRFPFRIDRHELVADTEGAGAFRGAPSAAVEIAVVDDPVEFMYMSDGTVNPALGANGGGQGAPAVQQVRRADGSVETHGSCGRFVVNPGESMISRCAGGGGYGDPKHRDVTRVHADVESGVISRQRAADVYGVAIDDDGAIDAAATAGLRNPLD